MESKDELEKRLEFHRAAVGGLRTAYLALVSGGVQSYSIGSRSLTKFDLETIRDELKYHEKEIAALESILSGGSRRKAVGVVIRDW